MMLCRSPRPGGRPPKTQAPRPCGFISNSCPSCLLHPHARNRQCKHLGFWKILAPYPVQLQQLSRVGGNLHGGKPYNLKSQEFISGEATVSHSRVRGVRRKSNINDLSPAKPIQFLFSIDRLPSAYFAFHEKRTRIPPTKLHRSTPCLTSAAQSTISAADNIGYVLHPLHDSQETLLTHQSRRTVALNQ